MPKETRHQTMERQQELLEVWGFDLLAHVEAMLRHARQYNQEVTQLRSHLAKGQTDTEQVPLDAVLQHVKELQRSSGLFSETLRAMEGRGGQRGGFPFRANRYTGRLGAVSNTSVQ